ncbi:dihydropteroate synthase [Thermosipho sp. (in: thermotogales)]|jgi:dihydropteroate synthase|uniref:dihydropteroate synthase n=1 Tax=Thermosipho sp. (in: thermotogales) TaxID=1968895 RepID=UPI00257EDD3F|nr:dihydropteroate synthase [Thermosipho sp. (in: thermotogales)]MBZ4651154.1 folP [Thermosipho sp. (in: thermotogales)]MDK2840077.1 dihydropteroate synthase [Thermosipho sp. (in: thermotogales)]
MKYSLENGKEINFDHTYIMGIINVTPDSFYPGSRIDRDRLIDTVSQMIKHGAEIIDVGGESTRPGAQEVSLEEELNRVVPAIEIIKNNFDIIVSVDTYKSKVAEESLKLGADIINDISAFRFDENMVNIAKKYDCPVILMHMKGTPRNMQQNPFYEDTIGEIITFLKERIEFSKKHGVEKIIIDPGIGFGKRLIDNLLILKHIDEFKKLGYPVLVGASRKSMIGMILDLPVEERLEGTLAITAYSVMKDVDIIRVHDVKENYRVVKVIEAIKNAVG